MTSTNNSTIPVKDLNVVGISSPHLYTGTLQQQTSQPDIKTPTFATPIGQQTPMQSLFPFDDQRTSGLSPNFLSLNAIGNLSSSSLLNGLTLTSPVASTSNTATLMNNNLMTSFQTSSNMSSNNKTVNTGQLNLGGNSNISSNNGIVMNSSNVLSHNAKNSNNVQTSVTSRPLFPDGQSGLLPNVTHTPLIEDAMRVYNSIFPQQQQQQRLSLNTNGNLENNNNDITTNGSSMKQSGNNKQLLEVGGMSPLTESFSDLKIDINSGQQVGQVLPSLNTTSSQVLPLEILSSVPSIPDGLIRGESAVSAASEGNAHFVPYFPDEPQISDGGLGASPTSHPTSGPTLQFGLQMGQPLNINNGGNVINSTLLNGIPTVSGFPQTTTMLSYNTGSNDMSTLDTSSLSKSYAPEYWVQQPFTIPVSQYMPMDFGMNTSGMYPPDTSNLYINSYVTPEGMSSQMGMGDYNMSMLHGQEMEGQATSNMGRRRQKQGGGQRTSNRNSRRNRNPTPNTSTTVNGSERSITKGETRQSHGENTELGNTFERDNVPLMDLVKHELIEKCARDQHGSRCIQRALETATLTEKSAVFKQIEKCALGLCEDVFGNYVIQKFFEHGTENHKITLAKILIGRVLPLTKSMYGCRVIQKALESVEQNLRIALVSELDGHVEECVRDQNGNHVIQKAIEEVSPEHLDFIVKTFHGKVYDFSTHPYGCRVIQRLLERCTIEQKEPLLHEILKQVSTLSKDQYGNYVVQHMLQHGTPKVRSAIIEIVANNIVSMSRQKFSSNVVEKLFTHSSDEEKDYLIEHIMGFQSESPPIVQMVRDQYGNYVIQKILEVTSQQQRNRLINRIIELVPNLRKLMFGKHISNKIERITGNQFK